MNNFQKIRSSIIQIGLRNSDEFDNLEDHRDVSDRCISHVVNFKKTATFQIGGESFKLTPFIRKKQLCIKMNRVT